MVAKIPLSALPGISPTRGEIDKLKASRFISTGDGSTCERVPQLIPPMGELSGRAEGGIFLIGGQTHAR